VVLAAALAQGPPQLPDAPPVGRKAAGAAASAEAAPGFVLGVVLDGRLTAVHADGLADLAARTPIGRETVFRIASTSKQFTAACIALLEERGVLSPRTPLATFFPEAPDWASRVEIRHLVHHRSGLPDYLDLHRTEVFTPAESLELLLGLERLRFRPGARFEYSNSNYLLLAEVVSRAAGVPFPEFARRELFEPLGMRHSHFHDDPSHEVPHAAHGYRFERGKGWTMVDTPLAHVGDGGLFTTVGDLARWAAELQEPRVLGRDWLRRMTTPWPSAPDRPGEGYAYGLDVVTVPRLGRVLTHDGAYDGFLAEFLVLRDAPLAVIVLANREDVPVSRLARRTARAVLEADDRPSER